MAYKTQKIKENICKFVIPDNRKLIKLFAYCCLFVMCYFWRKWGLDVWQIVLSVACGCACYGAGLYDKQEQIKKIWKQHKNKKPVGLIINGEKVEMTPESFQFKEEA